MLAEVSTKAISQAKQPTTFGQSKRIAREGGSIAGELPLSTWLEVLTTCS